MPHDVIMPALGMAQDTGKLLSWAKQPGDAVAAGDVLFEVETDKATMEVEAQADGFLGQVRASAGDDVPVGDVVAIIAETADEAEAPAPAAANTGEETQASEPTAGGDGALPDGAQVIMPALGMAQDTGLIVSWQKAPGDAVSADDVLLEVETDKSVMEVPAGHDGYVAAILADAKEAVPVGSVIAVISAEKPNNAFQRSAASAPPAAPEQASAEKAPEKPAPAKPFASTGNQKPAATAVPTGGRILASPKARRLAHEQGLDLARLVEHDVPQPFHVADLETLRALPGKQTAQETAAGSALASTLCVTARVDAAGTDDLVAWLETETGTAPSRRAIWARFASKAFRTTTARDESSLIIALTAPHAGQALHADPDHSCLGASITDAPEDAVPDLVLRDFTHSAISAASANTSNCPVFTIARDGAALCATLDYHESQLTEAEALAFVDRFAEALADPHCNLL